MLRVLNRVPPSRPGSVLDIVMLTAGTPIISQDQTSGLSSVAMYKLGDIVSCCLQHVLLPVFSLSPSLSSSSLFI